MMEAAKESHDACDAAILDQGCQKRLTNVESWPSCLIMPPAMASLKELQPGCSGEILAAAKDKSESEVSTFWTLVRTLFSIR